MKKQPKRPKFVSLETREIIAANVRRRMDDQFRNAPNRVELLAKRIGTSISTVQRVLNGEVGVTIDVLAQFAMGLRCGPEDLLRPLDEAPRRAG